MSDDQHAPAPSEALTAAIASAVHTAPLVIMAPRQLGRAWLAEAASLTAELESRLADVNCRDCAESIAEILRSLLVPTVKIGAALGVRRDALVRRLGGYVASPAAMIAAVAAAAFEGVPS